MMVKKYARKFKTVEDLLNVAQIEEGRFGFQFIVGFGKIIEETFIKFEPSAQKGSIN